jgi:hypothetical protein
VESEADLGRDIVFGRIEFAQKTGRDLVLPDEYERRHFHLGSVSLGYARELEAIGSLNLGFGVVGSLDVIGDDLAPYYGTRLPVGGMVFVRLRPARMEMPSMTAGRAGARHAHGH